MCVRFGLPFVLHLEKTVAWDLLQKEILEKMKYFLRPTVCIQVRMLTRRPACPVKVQPLQGTLKLRPEPQREKLSKCVGCVQSFRTGDLALVVRRALAAAGCPFFLFV